MSLAFTSHPILGSGPTDEEVVKLTATEEGTELLFEWHKAHEEAIDLSEHDPLRYGFSFPQWDDADYHLHDLNRKIVFVSGANGSSKTQYGAKTVIKCAMENPGSTIFCFAQDWEIGSVKLQQKYIYRYLPPELRGIGKGAKEYVKYSEKNGFTGGSLILPNGSEIVFATYSQFTSNRAKFEGTEVGSRNPTIGNLGFWFDEYLEAGDLFDTMVYRCARRNASLLLTFTPIEGYTPFVADLHKNSQVIQTRPTHELAMPNKDDPKSVDYIRVNEDRNLAIIYFATEENPWGGFESLARDNRHKSLGERLTRFYGIPVKSMTTLFPMFNTASHVTDALPRITKDTHTVYQVVDPAGARNYVSIWAAVDKNGYVTILREWPDRDNYGAWAEFGDPRWKFGPASKKVGYDVQGYVDLFKEIEDELGVEPLVRLGDSRFFAAENADQVDLFTEFANKDMFFEPTDGRKEEIGLAALDEWFKYNPNLPVDSANRPIVQIHKSCGNLIYALLNYGANGKKDEALKDFVDAIRYLRMANSGDGPCYYNPMVFQARRLTDAGY